MKILHIDSSARTGGSHSRALSAHLVAALRARDPDLIVDRLDLALTPPRHFGAWEAAATATPIPEHSLEMRIAIADSDMLVARVLSADALVIGAPIYNFGMPSTLKAFFDHISRNGMTFLADDAGMRGLLGDKKAAVLSVAGGAYGPGEMFDGLDALTPHIRAILGFMGVARPSFIAARPMTFVSADAAHAAFARALREAEALAEQWIP
ncbi:MAG: FMN-dependent NADH-azoreductase [Elsteraceae bacterium]